MKRNLICLGLTIMGLVCGLVVSPAQAATAPAKTVSGVAVSPAIQQIALATGKDSYSYSLVVANFSEKTINVTVSAADFKALNQNGGVAFLGDSASSFSRQHGLSNWLRVSSPLLTLKPNEQRKLLVRLAGLQNLPLGGHYGAVLLHVTPQEDSTGGTGSHVQLNQVVSSLVFLTTAQGGVKSVQLLKPAVGGLQFSLPSSLDLFFKATGNTQVTPRGAADITTGHGGLLRHAVINPNSALVLPDSTRLLSTTFPNVGHQPLWPGHYQLLVQYRVEGDAHFQFYRTSFYYVNPRPFVFLLLAILLLAVIWRLLNRPSELGHAPPALIVKPKQLFAAKLSSTTDLLPSPVAPKSELITHKKLQSLLKLRLKPRSKQKSKPKAGLSTKRRSKAKPKSSEDLPK